MTWGSVGQLHAAEETSFSYWMDEVYRGREQEEVSHFEHNLEVWRQLWRAMERSDVVLILADARCPLLHINPALIEHVTRRLGRVAVLTLTKADLVPPGALAKWIAWIRGKYPGLCVVAVSCPPVPRATASKERTAAARKDCARKRAAARAEVLDAVRALALPWGGSGADYISEADVDPLADDDTFPEDDEEEEGAAGGAEEEAGVEDEDRDARVSDRIHTGGGGRAAGTLTVGVVGQPNMGKSSLVNTLMQRKVVSVSRTPGHTKHIQTIYITPKVVLCDSPGVVFPRAGTPLAMQVLLGSYPVAQVREPYSIIRTLAEICTPPLPRALGLSEKEAPDCNRAANFILRTAEASQGVLVSYLPPGTAEGAARGVAANGGFAHRGPRPGDEESSSSEEEEEEASEEESEEEEGGGGIGGASMFAMLGSDDDA